MEPFRVIVTGIREFADYARLRAVLDAALSRRLPDVVILSGCGPGTDALATSYAVERGLHLVPFPLDFEHYPFNAADRRNARMAADADAAVVVWDKVDTTVGDLLGRVVRKGIPYKVLIATRTL
jgi:hypothetical protein